MTMKTAHSPIHSMTGFGSVEGQLAGKRVRIEVKTLNHRFLDLKLRLPREYSSAEIALRSLLQSSFSRGAVDFKLERVSDSNSLETKETVQIEPNLELAAEYHSALVKIQTRLGLSEPICAIDLASFPEVLANEKKEISSDEVWKDLEPLARQAIEKLFEMRAHEGAALKKIFESALIDLEGKIEQLRKRRSECETAFRSRLQEKISAILQAHPLPSADWTGPLLESRLAQELALVLDRTDIEEELIRFKSHLEHFQKTLQAGGSLGRKLDFLMQELHREINTLGNKAQDAQISETVVEVKVRLEQIREQVMNLE